MLAEDERDLVEVVTRVLKSECGHISSNEELAEGVRRLVGRLTTPRAILDEAERLLRARGFVHVDFAADGRVVISRCGDFDEGFFPALADAYEALKEGE